MGKAEKTSHRKPAKGSKKKKGMLSLRSFFLFYCFNPHLQSSVHFSMRMEASKIQSCENHLLHPEVWVSLLSNNRETIHCLCVMGSFDFYLSPSNTGNHE